MWLEHSVRSRDSQGHPWTRNRQENGWSCEPQQAQRGPKHGYGGVCPAVYWLFDFSNLSYLVEVKVTVPTYVFWTVERIKIMHAKHVVYFLRELFIEVQLKYPYLGFVIKMFLRPGVV